ncbi:MAG: hypothetical protein JNM17_09165 [Archangium sp.]|nr:hypothetical protein [Archangium sp.]
MKTVSPGLVAVGLSVLFAGCPAPSLPDAATDAGVDAPLAQLSLEDVDLGVGLEDAVLSTTVRVRNTGAKTVTLGAATLLSGHSGFQVAVSNGAQLATGESSDVTVSITLPRTGTLKRFQARFELAASDGVTVPFSAQVWSTPAFLDWSPQSVDFAFAPPTVPVVREVVFTNFSLQPVRLSQLSAMPSVFRVVATDSSDLTALTVPAAMRSNSASEGLVPGRSTVQLLFTPVVLGARTGTLSGQADVAAQSAFSIPLRGVGGGPVIDAPPVLDLGRIAYFPGAESFASRALVVTNVGTRPSPPDPRGNLLLGSAQGGAYWEVTALAGASVSEVCVGDFDEVTGCQSTLPAYDPQVGILSGTSTALAIPVRVAPGGFGQRRFELRIFSNDPATPQKVVAITVDAVQVPPCDVEITGTLDFGMLPPLIARELAITVRNRLTGPNDTCLISNLELVPSGAGAQVFSLTEPWVDLELAPGAMKQLGVRALSSGPVPPTPTEVRAKLVFNLASPLPRVEVPVSATLAAPCLSIAPRVIDFGTVGNTCASPARSFQIFNACATDVVIDSSSVVGAEFSVLAGLTPGTRVLAAGAAPVVFSLEYRPQDLGADVGALRVSVTENGQPRDYVLPLRGKSDATGSNSESFVQRTSPKVDVLLVVDDSANMGPRQTLLGQAVSGLLGFPSTLDVRVGVTSTELGPSAGLLHATDAGVKVVSALTPGGAAAVQELVQVGTSGLVQSCMEPATLAVTAPYLADPTKNAGLLRGAGTTLEIVCLTDARDQAPGLPASYVNRMVAMTPSELRYHVIGPFLPMAPMGCSYGTPNDGAHDLMVELTGGTKDEICSSAWPMNLQTVLARNAGYLRSFKLAARPDPMVPLTVSIDGVSIPPFDPNPMSMDPIWHYDPVTNEVVFEPLYAPEPGKTVTISFRAPCLP